MLPQRQSQQTQGRDLLLLNLRIGTPDHAIAETSWLEAINDPADLVLD